MSENDANEDDEIDSDYKSDNNECEKPLMNLKIMKIMSLKTINLKTF